MDSGGLDPVLGAAMRYLACGAFQLRADARAELGHAWRRGDAEITSASASELVRRGFAVDLGGSLVLSVRGRQALERDVEARTE